MSRKRAISLICTILLVVIMPLTTGCELDNWIVDVIVPGYGGYGGGGYGGGGYGGGGYGGGGYGGYGGGYGPRNDIVIEVYEYPDYDDDFYVDFYTEF